GALDPRRGRALQQHRSPGRGVGDRLAGDADRAGNGGRRDQRPAGAFQPAQSHAGGQAQPAAGRGAAAAARDPRPAGDARRGDRRAAGRRARRSVSRARRRRGDRLPAARVRRRAAAAHAGERQYGAAGSAGGDRGHRSDAGADAGAGEKHDAVSRPRRVPRAAAAERSAARRQRHRGAVPLLPGRRPCHGRQGRRAHGGPARKGGRRLAGDRLAAHRVTPPRIRVGRETLDNGLVEWSRWDAKHARLETGVAELGTPPARGECELVIASELVLLDQLRVPVAQQRRLAGSLRFLAEDAAIPDPENLHVAAAAASGKDNLAVALIERQWLARLLARLERAGIRAQAAWPECLLAPLPAQAWTVICGARTCYARTGELAGLVLDRVDGAGAPVALQLALDAAREAGRAPARIEIRVGEDAAPPDTSGWSAALGLPVEAAPAWHWSQSRERPGLDLLQGEFASRAAPGGWRRGLRRSAVLAATLVVVASC